MKKNIDISNMQCPLCKSSDLLITNKSYDLDKIHREGIICEKCKKVYPILWGVPYLGQFYEKDILGLIEIEANSIFNVKSDAVNNGADFMGWLNLIDKYVSSKNKDTFLKENGIKEKPWWFDTRYYDHITSKIFINQVKPSSKNLLDVGAGLGYDSMIYQLAGANVTSFEFNPILCKIALKQYPESRFIGGAAQNIPFNAASFDIVVANATLHHLDNIPKAIEEMLRVLKPGGFLITTSDPFRSDNSTIEDEIKIFNNNIYVLSGINEQSPQFSDLVKTYKKYEKYLEIKVFTRNCSNNLTYFKEWSFEECLQKLPTIAGSIDFLVKLKKEIPYLHYSQKNHSILSFLQKKKILISELSSDKEIINPADYAENIVKGISSIDTIVNNIPEQFLDKDIMSKDQLRFDLLNGWKIPDEEKMVRFAYKRARKFYHDNTIKGKYINIKLLIPYNKDETGYANVYLKINNKVILEKKLIRGTWNELYVLQTENLISTRSCMLEIGIEESSDSYVNNLFCVKSISFFDTKQETIDKNEIQYFGVETLLLTKSLQGNSINVLLSPDTTHGLDIINRLRKFNVNINAIIMTGQKSFFSWIPDVKVVEEYLDYQSDTSNNLTSKLKTTPHLVIAPDKISFDVLHSAVCQNLDLSECFVVFKDGYSYKLDSVLNDSYEKHLPFEL